MKKIITLFIFSTLIISCRENLQYGTVITHEYNPPYQTLVFLPIIIDKRTMLIPYFIYHNKSWDIEVEGIGSQGDTITRKFYIDQQMYDAIGVGSFICVNGMCDTDTAIHKIRKK